MFRWIYQMKLLLKSKVSSAETQSTIPYSLLGDGKLTAEIRWALKYFVLICCFS